MPITALLIEYDGSKFHGFQRQKHNPSIQEELEKAIFIIIKENVRITPAGRTDTGVHAKGMVISFSLEKEILNYSKFILSLNAITPKTISVLAGMAMPQEFNARFSCSEREYEYHIILSKFPHPLYEGRALWIREKVDFSRLGDDLSCLIGKHEFTSFTRAISVKNKSTQRQITHIDLKKSLENSGLYKLEIRGTGFLHNMVRILVGTIFQIASGKNSMSLIEILKSADRKKAGKTLPPYALYFKHAYYKNFPEIESLYNSEIFEPYGLNNPK